MARCYSLQSMLRLAPTDLLKEFFRKVVRTDLGLDWAKQRKTDLTPIIVAIGKLTKPEQDTVEQHLQVIHDISCPQGWEALEEAAIALKDVKFQSDCHTGSYYAKALWSYLHRPKVFQKAKALYIVATARWWRQRNDLLDFTKYPISKVELAKLARGLGKFLEKEEGRGKRCTAEHLQRGGKDYVLVHADDYPEEKLYHDSKGRLVPRTTRSTFLVLYELDRPRCTLQVDADIPRRHKEKLEIIFIGELFGRTLSPFVTPAFRIDQLKHETMRWVTGPNDAAEAKVVSLHLQSLAHPSESVVVNTDASLPGTRIYEQLREMLAIRVDQVKVTKAKVRFDFAAVDERPESHVTFDITEKSSTFHPYKVGEERADIIQRCLERSGVIENDPRHPRALERQQPYSQVG